MKRYDRNFLIFLQSRAKEPSQDIQIGESSDQQEMKLVDKNLNEKIPLIDSVQSNPKINCKQTLQTTGNLYTDLYRVSIVRTNLDPVKFFHIKLKALLMDPSDSNELIMDRILSEFTSSDLNSKSFCGTLAIVLCKKCLENNSFNSSFFIKRIFLLKKYLNLNEKFELEALSAIRYLADRVKEQSNFLSHVFTLLFNFDVINSDTFFKWKEKNQKYEQSLKTLSGFFRSIENQ